MSGIITSFESFQKFSSRMNPIATPSSTIQSSIPAIKYNFNPNLNKTKDELDIKNKDTHAHHDQIMSSDILTKLKADMKNASSLPDYAKRGLKGDPDSNFFEYLSLGNIPYYIGGPVLTSMFLMGATDNNLQAKASAIKKAKHIGVGVGLYYLASSLANKLIDVPVKIFRGIDLNHPYKDVVDCRAIDKKGYSPTKTEYHKVFESIDFTRWDLMHDEKYPKDFKPKDYNVINKEFNKLSKKFGINDDAKDSDSVLKPYIKKLIIASRAFKYALTIPLVTLGVGLAAQKPWGDLGKGLKSEIGRALTPSSNLSLKKRTDLSVNLFKKHLAKPMVDSFKSLWKGHSPTSRFLGKATIISSIAAPILANLKILHLTNAKNDKIIDAR